MFELTEKPISHLEVQEALKHLKARWRELYLDQPWTRRNVQMRAAICEKIEKWRDK